MELFIHGILIFLLYIAGFFTLSEIVTFVKCLLQFKQYKMSTTKFALLLVAVSFILTIITTGL